MENPLFIDEFSFSTSIFVDFIVDIYRFYSGFSIAKFD